jgi:hypothetical protein
MPTGRSGEVLHLSCQSGGPARRPGSAARAPRRERGAPRHRRSRIAPAGFTRVSSRNATSGKPAASTDATYLSASTSSWVGCSRARWGNPRLVHTRSTSAGSSPAASAASLRVDLCSSTWPLTLQPASPDAGRPTMGYRGSRARSGTRTIAAGRAPGRSRPHLAGFRPATQAGGASRHPEGSRPSLSGLRSGVSVARAGALVNRSGPAKPAVGRAGRDRLAGPESPGRVEAR